MSFSTISKIAKFLLVSSKSEKEVERLLLVLLKGTPFANKAFAVGGYVRDEYLGINAKDLDIVVEMKDGSEKLTSFIHKQFPIEISTPRQMGKGYPIWQITFKSNIEYKNDVFETKGAIIEFADTMKETFPDSNTRQRETEPGNLQDDVERRDFTVNMLMKDLTSGEIKDLTGVSKSDIEKGILRGHPNVSLDTIFSNDPLRMIRLVRFQAKYNWQIPTSVLKTVKRNADRIKIVSAERIMAELEKVMVLGKLDKAIRLMKVTGLLQYVLPEIEALSNVDQGSKHQEGDAFKHTLLVLQNAPKTIEGQLAALLHDVGKPQTQTALNDEIHFLGHEKVSAEIAEAILKRLKFDNSVISRVTTIVENHMRPHSLQGNASDKALRKFIRDVGDELVDAILDMAEADVKGKIPFENYVPELRKDIEKIRTAPIKMRTQPILNGKEIMDILDIKPSALVGQVGAYLTDLEDDYASKKKELTKEIAKQLILKKFK